MGFKDMRQSLVVYDLCIPCHSSPHSTPQISDPNYHGGIEGCWSIAFSECTFFGVPLLIVSSEASSCVRVVAHVPEKSHWCRWLMKVHYYFEKLLNSGTNNFINQYEHS